MSSPPRRGLWLVGGLEGSRPPHLPQGPAGQESRGLHRALGHRLAVGGAGPCWSSDGRLQSQIRRM